MARGAQDRRSLGQPIHRGDSIEVHVQANAFIDVIQREVNKFQTAKYYAALQRVNTDVAIKIQQGMRDNLQSQIGTHSSYGPRPQRPGQRLAKAIMNERNRDVYANAFTVGLAHWLDQSPAALYWRSIEEGMAGYTANVLFSNGTAFDGAEGPWSAPGNGGPHMRMGQFTRRGGKMSGARVKVRPIEAFDYSAGGIEAYAKVDIGDRYVRALRAAGFKNASQFLKPKK